MEVNSVVSTQPVYRVEEPAPKKDTTANVPEMEEQPPVEEAPSNTSETPQKAAPAAAANVPEVPIGTIIDVYA